MEEKPKFAASLAHTYIQEKIQETSLGRPYVMVEASWEGCVLLLQGCSLLGRLFEDNPEPFVYVLTAHKGEELSALNHLKSIVEEDILEFTAEATSFSELLFLWEKKRNNSTEDIANLFLKYQAVKMDPNTAINLVTLWGLYGAGLGLHYPYIVEDLFEASCKLDPSWKEIYELGFNVSPEQLVTSIQEATEDVVRLLGEFSVQHYPEILEE